MPIYEDLDNATKWKWWFLQRLYDEALKVSNIADLTSSSIDATELLTLAQAADPRCRRRLEELNDEGLIDGYLSGVSLTVDGRNYVEARRMPWPAKVRRWLQGRVRTSHIDGAIAGGVISVIVVLGTASNLPWWWPAGEPELPQPEAVADNTPTTLSESDT